ncbi:MAG: hypothetical protein J5905_01180 [Prevotella sp.]|nr:hypothetical protein [Prevotella sp.]
MNIETPSNSPKGENWGSDWVVLGGSVARFSCSGKPTSWSGSLEFQGQY